MGDWQARRRERDLPLAVPPAEAGALCKGSCCPGAPAVETLPAAAAGQQTTRSPLGVSVPWGSWAA